PARASTWHEPHFCANSFFPLTRSGFELAVFVQALSRNVAPAESAIIAPARKPGKRCRRPMRARTLSARADRGGVRSDRRRATSDGRRELVPAALGRGDHA